MGLGRVLGGGDAQPPAPRPALAQAPGAGGCVHGAASGRRSTPAPTALWDQPEGGGCKIGAALLHPPSGTSRGGDGNVGPGFAPAWPCACGKAAATPRLRFLPGGCLAGPRVRVRTRAVLVVPLHLPASSPELLVSPCPERCQTALCLLCPLLGEGARVSRTGLGFRSGPSTVSALEGSPLAEGMSHIHTEVSCGDSDKQHRGRQALKWRLRGRVLSKVEKGGRA